MEIKKIAFVEPYDGGSHRSFRTGLARHSRHTIGSLTLPARFWKWRMRGAAAWFADQINQESDFDCDLFLVSGYLNVADFRGLLHAPHDRRPILLYMHENQLTYPLSPEEEFDFHFGFTNIISALAADRVVFNSDYHRQLFLDQLPTYLGKMPEAVPRNVRARLEEKSQVLPVGLERRPLPAEHFAQYRGGRCAPDVGPSWPRSGRFALVWNHRWEFDKRPDLFTRAVGRLLDLGLDFDVCLLGDSRGHEDLFVPLRERLGDRCLAYGFTEDRAEYERRLVAADIVVSCAQQEYFGISVAEAVHAGCYPVLPQDQVYPSLYGSACKGPHFYRTEDELVDLLQRLMTGPDCGHVCGLDLAVDPCCWENLAPRFDRLLADVAAAGRRMA